MTATAVSDGHATLTLPDPDSGMLFRYKVANANAKPVVIYDMACTDSNGWVTIPSDRHIAGAASQVVTVVECTNVGYMARKKGEVTLR